MENKIKPSIAILDEFIKFGHITRKVQLLQGRTLRGSTYFYAVMVCNGKNREQVYRNEAYSIARERFLKEVQELKYGNNQ